MKPQPWWIARVAALLDPLDLSALELGALWRLSERLRFIRLNVEPALLALDCAAVPEAAATWADFGRRERDVARALGVSGEQVAARVRAGELGPVRFRAHWEGLGFSPNDGDAGTPADDFLDGVFHTSRLEVDRAPPDHGLLNLASRASRVADFLAVTNPSRDDVVFDLGSGSGKVALTVGASSEARVRGVELVPEYVAEASRSASTLGLRNVDFVAADARDLDLTEGSHFYLYHPFQGPVARAVAATLGAHARARAITIYAAGPRSDFGEHLLAQVHAGALTLAERRGQFDEVLVLTSAR